jgi:hypothetical protein
VLAINDIGVFISDLSVALFAFMVWYQQKTEQKAKQYIDIQKGKRIINETDLLIINTAFNLLDRKFIDQLSIGNNSKTFLLKQLEILYNINFMYLIILLLFSTGVILQAFSLLSGYP